MKTTETSMASLKRLKKDVTEILSSNLGDAEKEYNILGLIDDIQQNVNFKLNIIIRLLRLKVREKFARRLLFEINGGYVGGHPLSSEWEEEDWNLQKIRSKKVKEILHG